MKKIILLFMMLAGLTMSAQSKVSGVVTYYFNKYQGDKPDLGSKAVIIDSLNIDSEFYSLYQKYHYGTTYSGFIKRYETFLLNDKNELNMKKGKKKYADRVLYLEKEVEKSENKISEFKEQLKIYDVDTPEKLEDVGNKLSKYTVQLNEKHQSKTIDGSGNYSFDNISDGTYYVFLKSKNRNYLSIVEVSGQIYIEKVTLKGSVSKDVSKNFDIK